MLRHAARLGGRAFKAGATRAPLQAAAARAFSRLPRRVQAVVAISAPLRQAGLPGLALPSAARPPLAPALWQAYLQSLQQRPLVTKAATSFALTLISDSVAQVLGGVAGEARRIRLWWLADTEGQAAQAAASPAANQPMPPPAGYSIWRCVRLGLYSATVGALSGHYWHRHLDRACYPRKPRSVQAVRALLSRRRARVVWCRACAVRCSAGAGPAPQHLPHCSFPCARAPRCRWAASWRWTSCCTPPS